MQSRTRCLAPVACAETRGAALATAGQQCRKAGQSACTGKRSDTNSHQYGTVHSSIAHSPVVVVVRRRRRQATPSQPSKHLSCLQAIKCCIRYPCAVHGLCLSAQPAAGWQPFVESINASDTDLQPFLQPTKMHRCTRSALGGLGYLRRRSARRRRKRLQVGFQGKAAGSENFYGVVPGAELLIWPLLPPMRAHAATPCPPPLTHTHRAVRASRWSCQ